MLKDVKDFLAGKKTYLTALTAIVAAVVAWSNGTMPDDAFFQALLTAVLGITIRAGITTTGTKSE